MKKQVSLINDLAGYGNVALSAMLPVLTYMGCHVCNLPTALVSHTLDYRDISGTTVAPNTALPESSDAWEENSNGAI